MMVQPSLRDFSLFQGLNENAQADLAKSLRQVSYRAGDLIFQEGGPSVGIYLILSGFVQFGKLSTSRHRRRILKLIGPGEVFGEEGLFNSEFCSCPGYARALTETSLVFVERSAFLGFADRHPQVMRNLSHWLIRQMKVFECKLVELAYEPFEQNLWRLLIILMERFGIQEAEGIRIAIPLGRQELADLLGAHQDTIIHELSRLRDQELLSITVDHQILIKEPDKLRKLAEPHTTCIHEKLF